MNRFYYYNFLLAGQFFYSAVGDSSKFQIIRFRLNGLGIILVWCK